MYTIYSLYIYTIQYIVNIIMFTIYCILYTVYYIMCIVYYISSTFFIVYNNHCISYAIYHNIIHYMYVYITSHKTSIILSMYDYWLRTIVYPCVLVLYRSRVSVCSTRPVCTLSLVPASLPTPDNCGNWARNNNNLNNKVA